MFFQAKGESVGRRSGQIGKAIVQLQNEGRGRERTQGDRRITSLQSPEGVPADEEPCRHFCGRNATFTSSQGEIPPKLPKSMGRGEWDR